MADKDDELADYTVTDSDGVERQYSLSAKDAKERGAVPLKARTPQNKAVTPGNKAKG